MNNTFLIDIQQAQGPYQPLPVSENDLREWAKLALSDQVERAELTIRIVDKEEITSLNRIFRNKNKPTNVLAFPAEIPETVQLEYPLLGDIIICPDILFKESKQLNTPLNQHWAHIVIHGVLHLLGYDHIIDSDAQKMQKVEIALLDKLGFENPYYGELINHE